MENYNQKLISTIRLNSFRPLCSTKIGLKAIEKYNLPPFIDGSCRREPDFENSHPSITSLCRQGSFAPHLYPNDIIVYITVKGKWYKDFSHHRLVAILKVIDKKENHIQASEWYKDRKYSIPSNCMISNNFPYNFDKTTGNFLFKKDEIKFLKKGKNIQEKIGNRRVQLWDNEYLKKSIKWEDFIITQPIFTELHNPPMLKKEDMISIFGKVPNTRNPNKIKINQLIGLSEKIGINLKRM